MSRDAKRALVYAVEQAVFEETLFAEPLGARGVVELASALSGDTWWVANGVPFTVQPARREAQHSSASAGRAESGGASIRLSVHQEDAATLAHEAAHLLASRHHAEVAHGPVYLTAEVDVVAVVCGTVAAQRLDEAFDEAQLPRVPRSWAPPTRLTERGLYGRWRLGHLTRH